MLGGPLGPAAVAVDAWPYLVGIGLIATFLAIQTLYAGARRIGAAQAALISTTEPLFIVALSFLFLDQTLAPIQLAGAALIVAGVVIAQTSPRPTRRARAGDAARGGGIAGAGLGPFQPRPAARSIAAAPADTNDPSAPRPTNRNPSSRWGSRPPRRRAGSRPPCRACGRRRRPSATHRDRPVHRTAPERRGRATGRPGRRTAHRPRRAPRSRPRPPRRRRFDLDDAEDPLVDDSGQVPWPSSPSPPPRVRRATPACADRRVAQVRDGVADLLDRLELREHDPRRSEVERPAHAEPLRGLWPDDRCHARIADGVQQPEEVASVAAPCSRSSTVQSIPARPRSSAASGDPRSLNEPMSVSPARTRDGSRSCPLMMPGTGVVAVGSVMADMMPGRASRVGLSGVRAVDQPAGIDDLEVAAGDDPSCSTSS